MEATIVSINPLTERGFVNFSDPKDAWEMLTNTGRKVASEIYNVRIGGDHALMKGLMKRLVEWDDAGRSVIDHAFAAEHTVGLAALLQDLRDESWETIVSKSGLAYEQINQLAELYAKSKATIATWCMGITHHEDSVATIESIVDLLLMRGNIGKPGAGAVPVRGHSNVQGDRTMGCTFKVPDRWLDNMAAEFPGLKPTRAIGKDAIGVINGLIDGDIEALISLGGNFGRASPDSSRLLTAMGRSKLTVHIATKFNLAFVPGYDAKRDENPQTCKVSGILKLPQALIQDATAIIPGIDGQKMSKSYNNAIELFADDAATKKKIMGIKSDSTPVEAPKDPGASPIHALLALFATESEMAEIDRTFREGGTGYGHYKQQLLELFHAKFDGARAKRKELEGDRAYVEKVLADGAEKARALAAPIMKSVREATGLA